MMTNLKNKKTTDPNKSRDEVVKDGDKRRSVFDGGQKIGSDWVGRSIGADISKFTKGRKEKTLPEENRETAGDEESEKNSEEATE